MPENMPDARKAFEAIARIAGQKEKVEVVVRKVKKKARCTDEEQPGQG